MFVENLIFRSYKAWVEESLETPTFSKLFQTWKGILS